MRKKTPAACAAVALALAACGGAVVTYNEYVVDGFRIDELAFANREGDTLVVIRGNPFDIPKPQFDVAVTDAMQGKNFGPVTNFTTTPQGEARPSLRVVMLFDGPLNLQLDEPCGDLDKVARRDPGAGGGEVIIQATFCSSDQARTAVAGRVTGVTDPSDPRFELLVGTATRTLFPIFPRDLTGADRDR